MRIKNQWLAIHCLLVDLGFVPLYAKARKVVERSSQGWPGTFRMVPYFKRTETSGNVKVVVVVHGTRIENVANVLLPCEQLPIENRFDRERTRLVDFARELI